MEGGRRFLLSKWIHPLPTPGQERSPSCSLIVHVGRNDSGHSTFIGPGHPSSPHILAVLGPPQCSPLLSGTMIPRASSTDKTWIKLKRQTGLVYCSNFLE